MKGFLLTVLGTIVLGLPGAFGGYALAIWYVDVAVTSEGFEALGYVFLGAMIGFAVGGVAGCALLLRLGRARAVLSTTVALAVLLPAAMWLALALTGRVEADEALPLLVIPCAPMLARLSGLALSRPPAA